MFPKLLKKKKDIVPMGVKIVGNQIRIVFQPPAEPDWQIVVRDRSGRSEAPSGHFALKGLGEKVEASTHIENFNALKSTLEVRSKREIFCLDTAFDKYRLEPTLVEDHPYMTKTLFGAGTRSLSDDDLFYSCYSYLTVLPPDNAFYGGLITLLAFRISEDMKSRSQYLDDLIAAHRKMMQHSQPKADHSIRWRLSSSVNLANILCYAEREVDARHIVNTAINDNLRNGIFPLTQMNYATLLSLAGMFSIRDEDRDRAYIYFSECANYCNVAVADLFSLRNNFYFQHEHDVRTLVDLGYQAATSMALLTTGSHPGDSKMPFSVGPAPVKRLTFTPVFKRYVSRLKRHPRIAEETAKALQEKKR